MRKGILKHAWLWFLFLIIVLLIMANRYWPHNARPVSALMTAPVTVSTFGAVPIEISKGFNSTSAFQKALSTAISRQVPLVIPTGTFEVDSGMLKATIPAGKSLEIMGEGEKSIIRRRSHSVIKDFQDMLSVTSSEGHVSKVILRNFSLDGNAAGNQLPAGNLDPYLWEHSSGIRINGASDSARIKNVVIENVNGFDPIADHIYFPGMGDSFVDTVRVNGFNGYARNRTRSDITVTGGLKRLYVEHSKFTRLEVELNRPYRDVFRMQVSDIEVTQKLDISGDHMEFYGDRIHAAHVGLWKAKGWIRDSTLHFQQDIKPPRAGKLYAFQFIDTDFYYPVAADGSIYPFTLNDTYNVKFDHCRFLVDRNAADITVYKGLALEVKPQNASGEQRLFEVRNSWFDPRFSGNIRLDRSGAAVLINNEYSGSNSAIFMSGSKKKRLKVLIEGGDFKRVNGLPFQFDDVEGLYLTIKNLAMPFAQAGYIKSKPSSDPIHVSSERELYTTKPPDGAGIKGDTVKLTNSHDPNLETWIAEQSDSKSTKWTRIPRK